MSPGEGEACFFVELRSEYCFLSVFSCPVSIAQKCRKSKSIYWFLRL